MQACADCHPWDSNVKVSSYFSSLTHFSSHNHTNYFSLPLKETPQQDTPVPHMPCKQMPWQPTPGLSGTQWLEDLFREPFQHTEAPIQSSKSQVLSHEDISTREPEPELVLLLPTLSLSLMICLLAPPSTPTPALSLEIPTASSPHSQDEAQKEFTYLQTTLMIPQANVHDSINQILLEHCRFLHIIPFVDAAHQNEMHQGFQEELNSLLGQALEAYPKEDMTGIVSRFLKR
ncbi:hypothetical protein O181_069524 [Austropuccinia psidii MF-1]|uniref:Uncharacterized protein n=1 Tax=Austropuccinia psidii MF-1 TaxID=1389203 RepID=A0A9Q3I8L3_9BASI|nr:hypothetical protein [Austropuccinia psidii MF-1]